LSGFYNAGDDVVNRRPMLFDEIGVGAFGSEHIEQIPFDADYLAALVTLITFGGHNIAAALSGALILQSGHISRCHGSRFALVPVGLRT